MTVLGTETYASYVDLTDMVKPWLQINPADTSRDFQLDIITNAVCVEAQRYIGGPIAPTTFGPSDGLGKFDGAAGVNSGYIMLPRRPVISIVELIEYQGDSPVQLYEVDPSTGNTGGDGFQINYRTGRLTRVLGGVWNRPFYPGSNNVWVTWQAGYNPVPSDIIWATLDWIGHVFRNTQQQSGLRGPGLGPSNEFEPAETSAGLWQGIPYRIGQVLDTYQKVGIR